MTDKEQIEDIDKKKSNLYELKMQNGEIDMTIGNDNAKYLIYSIVQIFRQNNAENFFTTTIEFNNNADKYAFTIQKVGGKSVGEELCQLKQNLEQVRKETAKEILNKVKERLVWFIENTIQKDHFNEQMQELSKEYGVEIEE